MATRDWSAPSGWQGQSGQIPTPGGAPQGAPAGVWGSGNLAATGQMQPWMQQQGGPAGMFGAPQMQPWMQQQGAPQMQQYSMMQGGGQQGGAPQQYQAYQQPSGGAPNAAPNAAPEAAPKIKNNSEGRPNWWPPGLPWPGDSGDGGGLFGGNQNITQTFEPWEPQGKGLQGLYKKGEAEYAAQRKLGGPKFSQESLQALNRMEAMTGQPNPLVNKAVNAITGITGGDTRINTADKFNQLYNQEGITNASQYGKLYNNGTFSNEQSYRDMMNENPITGINDYNKLAQTGGITGTNQYQNMANQNAIGTGRMEDIYGIDEGVNTGNFQSLYKGSQGAGSLSRGAYDQIAAGNLMNANPHREQNIKQSMGDTSKMVKASMSKAGRYGSDAYGDAMGKALSSVATQAREAGYNQDTANMMAAAVGRSQEALGRQGIGLQAAQGVAGAQGANIGNRMAAAQSIMGAQGQNAAQRLAALQGMTGAQNLAAQTQLGAMGQRNQAQLQNQQSQFAALQGLTGMQNLKGQQQLAAAQGLTNVQAQNAAQRMAAAQGLTGVQSQNIANQLQAAGMTPEMQKLRYDDMNRLLGIGATKEAMTQQQRDFGWQQLQQLQNTYGGLPGQAGQSSQQTQQPWWQQAAGLGMLGMGMFGQ